MYLICFGEAFAGVSAVVEGSEGWEAVCWYRIWGLGRVNAGRSNRTGGRCWKVVLEG